MIGFQGNHWKTRNRLYYLCTTGYYWLKKTADYKRTVHFGKYILTQTHTQIEKRSRKLHAKVFTLVLWWVYDPFPFLAYGIFLSFNNAHVLSL